jgi:hypothetical protein
MFLQPLRLQMHEKTILVWRRITVKCPRSSPHLYYLVVYVLRSYASVMFDLIERPATDIRFTPLWWIGAVLGAGAIFFLNFVRITWLGGLMGLASTTTIWYAYRRSRKLLRRDDHIWTNQESKNEL